MAEYLFYECEDPKFAPLRVFSFAMATQVHVALGDPKRVAAIFKKLIISRWFIKYRLAVRFCYKEDFEMVVIRIIRKMFLE